MFAFPPRRMRADAAAHYLGVSSSTFLDRVAAGDYPAGLKEGGCRLWLREDLDGLVDRQFGVTNHPGIIDMQRADEDPFAARFRD